jgi:hypothetical protein
MPSASDLFERRSSENMLRDENGAALLTPMFVLSQGAGVSEVDLRTGSG